MSLEEKNLEEIESLLSQSLKGIHYLFKNEDIKRILNKPTEDIDFFSFSNMDKIQDLFTDFIECETLQAKEDYLRNLDSDSYEILLRTYFHIVENTILASSPHKH